MIEEDGNECDEIDGGKCVGRHDTTRSKHDGKVGRIDPSRSIRGRSV